MTKSVTNNGKGKKTTCDVSLIKTQCVICGKHLESQYPVTICDECVESKTDKVDTNTIYKNSVFTSGKYAGELISDIAVEDSDYCIWVVDKSLFGYDTKEACKYHLGWL